MRSILLRTPALTCSSTLFVTVSRVIGYDSRYQPILGPVGKISYPTPEFIANLFKNNVDFVNELTSLSANPERNVEGTPESVCESLLMIILT